jgi:WD repeat-containing protein 21A
MVSTLGSGESGGSVYIMDMSGTIDFPTVSLNSHGRIERVASFDRTVWTADCNSEGTQAVLGELTEIGLQFIPHPNFPA